MNIKLKHIIEIDGYLLKNYTLLSENEKKIALDFRNNNRKWMINNNLIDLKEHSKWIETLKTDQNTIYFLVFKDNIPFMSIDFHNINKVKKEAYWGYFLGKKKYRTHVLKIESVILKLAFEYLKLEKLFCVNDVNNHVIKIHKFFGFQEGRIISINERQYLEMFLGKEKYEISSHRNSN